MKFYLQTTTSLMHRQAIAISNTIQPQEPIPLVRPFGALGGQAFVGKPWYPTTQNLVKMWLGRDSNPCTQEKDPWPKKLIEMRHRSPVRYRLDHGGQLLGMVVLVGCILASWVIHTPMLVHCSPGLGYTPGYRDKPQPKRAMCAKAMSAHWRIGRKS